MSFLDSLLSALPGTESKNAPAYLEPLLRRDFVSALPHLKAAMNRDDASAMGFYGAMCIMGLGVPKDHDEGVLWFRQAAVRGNPLCKATFGMCLAQGFGVERNEREATFWLFEASKDAVVPAMEFLCDMVMRNHSLVGEHFTEDELCEISLDLKRIYKVRLHPASKNMH